MKIQPPDDDVRLQKLNRPAAEQGAQSRPVEQTDPVRPSDRIDETLEHVQRGGEDRRKGERRKHQVKVLLDTRSGRERRGEGRRQADREKTAHQAETPRPKGINLKA